MLDDLRLELAENQIRVAELEHEGDGQLQQLEKSLMEAKMANARLQEDNESFQLLLSEKTLKGDFMQDVRNYEPVRTGNSLAEELESVSEGAEGESEAYRKLEGEVRSLREGNKALTLYIDKIIGRLLQHEGFEHIIHDKDESPELPAKSSEKPLPTPPAPAQAVPSLLQRARSVVAREGGKAASRPRPISHLPAAATQTPSTHTDPKTAPSIPLNRAQHKRARSDQADGAAAVVVGHMVPQPPVRTTSGGPLSPGLRPVMSPSVSTSRVPIFNPGNPAGSREPSGSRAPSGSNRSAQRGSSSNSIVSDHSGEINSDGHSSPPRSTQGMGAIPGAVMKQNQMRPLRLVREQEDAEAARKKANRGSWMGWFNRGVGDENRPPG